MRASDMVHLQGKICTVTWMDWTKISSLRGVMGGNTRVHVLCKGWYWGAGLAEGGMEICGQEGAVLILEGSFLYMQVACHDLRRRC